MKWHDRFKWAFSGLVHALKCERNLQIHFAAGVVVLILAFAFRFEYMEKLILLIIIGAVISLELVNTAIERTVDLVSEEFHPLAKRAKDVAAAAVLIFTIIAVITGIAMFVHHFM
ncbi:MAG TPA: diacylglycerol kinase family protein [Bacillales bacterium]|nr:diacylglycerol kinase family protein [Bacillales bacterium]